MFKKDKYKEDYLDGLIEQANIGLRALQILSSVHAQKVEIKWIDTWSHLSPQARITAEVGTREVRRKIKKPKFQFTLESLRARYEVTIERIPVASCGDSPDYDEIVKIGCQAFELNLLITYLEELCGKNAQSACPYIKSQIPPTYEAESFHATRDYVKYSEVLVTWIEVERFLQALKKYRNNLKEE